VHPLAHKVLERDPRGVARACRVADDRLDGWRELLKDLYPHTGNAWIVGVTGNPGAGKSTLCDRLIAVWRGRNMRVAVVAVDPTSPFSGGAILGDRIRMQRHFEDPDVFIRSLATRGALGGLSRSSADVVRVLDAWGAHVVLVETVGVGQDELEVTRTAHSTLIVMAPGMGDDVQAIKAGILECGDVFAVNKADRDGADATVRDLELMIALGQRLTVAEAPGHGPGHVGAAAGVRVETGVVDGRWTPPVLRCVATQDQGTDEVVRGLEAHRTWLRESEAGTARSRARFGEEMRNQMREALVDATLRDLGPLVEEMTERVARREVDPYTACEQLVAAFRLGG
jgi:LAO/AO transport system kinase